MTGRNHERRRWGTVRRRSGRGRQRYRPATCRGYSLVKKFFVFFFLSFCRLFFFTTVPDCRVSRRTTRGPARRRQHYTGPADARTPESIARRPGERGAASEVGEGRRGVASEASADPRAVCSLKTNPPSAPR